MNVVDSSAWLEYFGDGPNAVEFAAAIEDPDALVAPRLALPAFPNTLYYLLYVQ